MNPKLTYCFFGAVDDKCLNACNEQLSDSEWIAQHQAAIVQNYISMSKPCGPEVRTSACAPGAEDIAGGFESLYRQVELLEQRFVTRCLMRAIKLCNHSVVLNMLVQDIPRNSSPVLSQSEVKHPKEHAWMMSQ